MIVPLEVESDFCITFSEMLFVFCFLFFHSQLFLLSVQLNIDI